jgi:hypothetical protein
MCSSLNSSLLPYWAFWLSKKARHLMLNQGSYFPTRIVESSPMSPKTLRSHKTTTMITTAFKIDLMEPAMGMYELMSQRITPTTTKTTITLIKGMIYSFFCFVWCPKLLGTYFSSLTPKTDLILDGQAMNLKRHKRMLLTVGCYNKT